MHFMILVQYRDHTSSNELVVASCQDETDLRFFYKHDGSALSICDTRDIGSATPFKVIIAGTRYFQDYPLLCRWMDYYLQNIDPKHVVIISGMARGADSLGEQYARDHGFLLHQCPADWDRYGKSAGYRRNVVMAEVAGPGGACVCFWDGKSRGTQHMINIAKEHNLLLRVVNYEKGCELPV